jgi:predicted metal-binding membrane protein
MKLSTNDRTRINFLIFGVSLLAWGLLLFNPGNIMTVEHCSVSDAGASENSLNMLLDMNPVSSQLAGWGLMVIAMMLPKLIMPINNIYGRSLKRRRLHLSLMFVFSYLAIWMLAGIFIGAVILGLHLLMPGSYLPAIGLSIINIIWQCSPIKQRYLNKGHDHTILAAFGWPAYRDALRFGVMHGVWCVGSGWALMLLPMLLPAGHNVAMIIVTFMMLSEHLEHPQRPGWRINSRAKLLRIIVAQTQIRRKAESMPL